MRNYKKWTRYLVLRFSISLCCAEAKADLSLDEIVTMDLLILEFES
jgi:hypothetical protein